MLLLDPDGDPREFIRAAWEVAKDHQMQRNQQYGRDYLLMRAFVDMRGRDDLLPHIAVPKIWSVVKTNAAREMKAHFGSSPLIESETEWLDMQEIVELQNKVLHDFLKRGNFYFEADLACNIKSLFGTAFMEVEPFRRKRVIAIPHDNGLGGFNIEHVELNQLHLRINTRAPWECMFAPLTRDLETPDGCPWCLKYDLTSKRMIRQQAMSDPEAYPGLDLDALGRGGLSTEYYNDHVGYQILESFGLQKPRMDNDDDLCILFRMETPDRYIWSLNANDILRDTTSNPYHDMVNLSRWPHTIDPHTQSRLYGIGDAKPNEIIQNMQSDALSLFFQVWAYSTQPAMLFRKGVDIDDLIMSLGNRIPVDDSGDPKRALEDYTHTITGAQVTRDQVEIFPILDKVSDMAAVQWEPMRGEPTKGQHTLGEIGLAQQAGDVITESRIRLGEEVFKDSFRRKCLAIIDGYSTVEDLMPILGPEDAMKVFTMNPDRVPGGCNLTLSASTSVSDLRMKLEVDAKLQPIIANCFEKGMFDYARKMLKDARWDTNEIDAIVGSAEEQFQMQMQMQQDQMQMEQMQSRQQQQQQGQAAQVQAQQAQQSNQKDLAIALINAKSRSQMANQRNANKPKPKNRMVNRTSARQSYAGALQ